MAVRKRRLGHGQTNAPCRAMIAIFMNISLTGANAGLEDKLDRFIYNWKLLGRKQSVARELCGISFRTGNRFWTNSRDRAQLLPSRGRAAADVPTA